MKYFSKAGKKRASGEWRATIWYTAASLFTKAFGFLTIPLYTNLLSTGEYGYLNTYNAWISLLSVILGLSLSSAVISIQKERKEILAPYQSSVLGLSLVSFLLMGGAILGVSRLIAGEAPGLLVLALVQSYATFVMNFILQEMVLDNRYVRYSLLSILSAVVPILITCAILPYLFPGRKYLDVILPKAAVAVGIMLAVMAAVFVRGKQFYNREYWKQSLSYCVPIIFHTLALSVMLQADRIMLSYFRGYEKSGIYSFIYNVTLVIGVVVAALENTWKTWFFQAASAGKTGEEGEKREPVLLAQRVNQRAGIYLVCGEAGILTFVYLSPELVRLLANEAYWDSAYLTAPIAFAYILSLFYDFLVYYEYYENATRRIAGASLVAAGINIGLNLIAIPLWGPMGAAVTTIFARMVQFLLHLRTVHRLNRDVLPFRVYRPSLIRSVGMTAGFLLFYPYPVIRFGILAGYLMTRGKGIRQFFRL